MIGFDDVSFAYEGQQAPSLHDVSLHVEAGECVLVTGPSGCGKSTLLRLVNGLIPHLFPGGLSGTVRVGEGAASEFEPGAVPLYEQSGRTGSVFQNPRTHIAWRGFKVILVVALVFWLLTYSPTGVIDDSFIGAVGMAIEPVTRFFGMGWRTFVAFLGALMAKEAMLGVLAALFASADPSMVAAASGTAAAGFSVSTLAAQIPGPEALAFLFAVAFNVPCVMTLGATYSETHSLKWTATIALFYFAMALCISFVVFHVASLFM